MKKTLLSLAIATVAIAVILHLPSLHGQQTKAAPAITVDNDDLAGVVTSSKGPEAGVWVIAETTDLPTKFSKTVVTNDRGQYLIPDLPAANYSVWVRGFGLLDSPKTNTRPGRNLNLTAVIAPGVRIPLGTPNHFHHTEWYPRYL